MRIFIDESLSPRLASRLNAEGGYDAIHPRDVGRRGEPDHRVLARCTAEDRIIVTQNARDFRRLVGNVDIHPGLIILPCVDREGTWALLKTAIASIKRGGDPARVMLNHVLEVSVSGKIELTELPRS